MCVYTRTLEELSSQVLLLSRAIICKIRLQWEKESRAKETLFKTTNIVDNGILLFPKENVLIYHKADHQVYIQIGEGGLAYTSWMIDLRRSWTAHLR